MIGCFGGMSLAAALCSHLIITRQARLAMNGPEVIEQEAGVEELCASDRGLIWSLIGGEQRFETGFADALVDDDVEAIARAVRQAFVEPHTRARTLQIQRYRECIALIDPGTAPGAVELRKLFGRGDSH
jgi:malonate decarboxylase beta subunit